LNGLGRIGKSSLKGATAGATVGALAGAAGGTAVAPAIGTAAGAGMGAVAGGVLGGIGGLASGVIEEMMGVDIMGKKKNKIAPAPVEAQSDLLNETFNPLHGIKEVTL
jgi:phage tail tape-measure protein